MITFNFYPMQLSATVILTLCNQCTVLYMGYSIKKKMNIVYHHPPVSICPAIISDSDFPFTWALAIIREANVGQASLLPPLVMIKPSILTICNYDTLHSLTLQSFRAPFVFIQGFCTRHLQSPPPVIIVICEHYLHQLIMTPAIFTPLIDILGIVYPLQIILP